MLKEYYTWKEVSKTLKLDDYTLFILCNDGALSTKPWKAILREEMTNPRGAKTKIEEGTLSYDIYGKGGVRIWWLDKIVNEQCKEKLFSCKFKRVDIERYAEKAGITLSNKPDHNYWYRIDLWTFWDTVWLLGDIDPRTEKKQGKEFSSNKRGFPWFKEKTLSEFGLNPDDHEIPENLNLLFTIYESGNDRDLLFKSIDGLGDLSKEIRVIPNAVINHLYNRKDVTIPDRLKPLGDIIINNKTDDSTPQASEPKEKRNIQPESVNSFINSGGLWTVTYCGKEKLIQNTDRIKYIAYLLSTPGKKWDWEELYVLVGGRSHEDDHWKKVKQTFKGEKNSKNNSNGVAERISNSPQLSEEDKQLFKNTLNKSFHELKNAIREESEKIPSLQSQYEKIRKHLENEYGATVKESDQGVKIEFRNRLDHDSKKNYDKVRKHIINAIKQIKDEGLPNLADHLKKYIKKSNRYHPPPDCPKWDVKM